VKRGMEEKRDVKRDLKRTGGKRWRRGKKN
jgi:hypothetical protein